MQGAASSDDQAERERERENLDNKLLVQEVGPSHYFMTSTLLIDAGIHLNSALSMLILSLHHTSMVA